MRSDLALAALASAAVPGMKPVAVAALVLEEDSDHQQAVVEDATGRRWLVRSPLTPTAGARLQRGDELVRQLSRHVPFKVPAPVGFASVGKDGQAVVYPHVEGAPLDFAHLPAGAGLASAVGRAVAAIHNIPRGMFEEQDVPVFDAAGCRQRLISEVDRAAETGRVPTGLLARWEEAFDAAPLWQFATTPVHGSFRGASVLVAFADEDAASGRVVAVTDWEEAMVADPAVDLAELFSTTAPQSWESVLDAYTLARAQRPDPYLHARARLVAETRRLRGLALSVASGDEPASRRVVEALRRLDRLTEAEDSLVPAAARGVGETPGQTSRDAAGGARAAVGQGGTAARAAAVTHIGGTEQEAVPRAAGGDVAGDDDAEDDRAEHNRAGDITTEVPVAQAPAPPDNQRPEGQDHVVEAAGTRTGLGADGATGTQDAEMHLTWTPEAQDAVDADPDGIAGDDLDTDELDPAADELDPAADELDPAADTDDADGSTEDAGAGEAVDSGAAVEADRATGGREEPRHIDASEDLDDEDRLHELYGMPSPEAERDR